MGGAGAGTGARRDRGRACVSQPASALGPKPGELRRVAAGGAIAAAVLGAGGLLGWALYHGGLKFGAAVGISVVMSALLGVAVKLARTTRRQRVEMAATLARLEREGAVLRTAERALAHHQEQLQAILDNCTACIYLKGLDGRHRLGVDEPKRAQHGILLEQGQLRGRGLFVDDAAV